MEQETGAGNAALIYVASVTGLRSEERNTAAQQRLTTSDNHRQRPTLICRLRAATIAVDW